MAPDVHSCLAAFLTVWVAFPGSASPGPIEAPAAAGIELRDQLGGSDSVAAHRGRVTVAMIVTAARLRNLKAWQRDLEERFDGLDFVLIADVPDDSRATFEQVANKLAQRVPSGVAVLIDIEGRWAAELGLDTARPNILLFGRDGSLAASFRGRLEPALFAAVSERIESLVEK